MHVSDLLRIGEVARASGLTVRTLHHYDEIGLLVPSARSDAGYRLYGPAELQRLRTLRELLERHDVGLAEVGFAARMREDAGLRSAVDDWLAAQARRPENVPDGEWLRFEQEKHERLLAAVPTP